jgi:hypothetical protein
MATYMTLSDLEEITTHRPLRAGQLAAARAVAAEHPNMVLVECADEKTGSRFGRAACRYGQCVAAVGATEREETTMATESYITAVHPARTGWVVEHTSRVQGCITGSRYLIPYSYDAPRGADLETEWNDYMSLGQYLASPVAREGIDGVRCLRRGHIVG